VDDDWVMIGISWWLVLLVDLLYFVVVGCGDEVVVVGGDY